MPEIGEIKKGKEIGYKNTSRTFIWHACEGCGKERWVPFEKGIVRNHNCRRGHVHAKNSHNWRGGKYVDRQGYIMLYLQPDDFFYSMTTQIGYVCEHRLVMAKSLGRCLQPFELVHHLGTKYLQGSREDKADNRKENLELTIKSNHSKEHSKGYSKGYQDGFSKGYNEGRRLPLKSSGSRTQLTLTPAESYIQIAGVRLGNHT